MLNRGRVLTIGMLVFSLIGIPLAGNNIPNGLNPVFKGIEPGKPFHPIWPPIVGQSLVGAVVIAKSVNKPEAYFGSIEVYRASNYAGQFKTEQLGYDAPTMTQSHNIDVSAAYTQLDAIASAVKSGAKAANLVGKSIEQNGTEKPSAGTSSKTTSDPSALLKTNPAISCGGSDATENASDTSAPKQQDQAGAKSTSKNSAQNSGTTNGAGNGQPPANKTGFDFSKMSSATVQICGLAVVNYSLDILGDINSGKALNANGNNLLTVGQRGWIVNRALVVTSMEYTLTSSTAVDAGFFAKLSAWLPGVSVKYKNAQTIVLRTTSPLTIGYKLWRPGESITGASTEDKPENVGRGSKEIDDILSGQIH